jgi:hypothetical protein
MKKYLFLLLFIFVKCAPQIDVWPAGEIPYCYGSSFTSSEQYIIEYAMESWEKSTDIKFIKTECNVNVVIIQRSNENCSTVGFMEYPYIKLSNIILYIVQHELGHTIGLPHEHQRPDRDNYITIHYENIKSSWKDQFDIFPKEYWSYDYTKYPYDYNSIMHYGSFAASKNGEETIESPVPIWNFEITQEDYKKVRDIYTADVYED